MNLNDPVGVIIEVGVFITIIYLIYRGVKYLFKKDKGKLKKSEEEFKQCQERN